MKLFRVTAVAALTSILTACGGTDPGPLKGTWRLSGVMPMTVHFRASETEALGIIEKVSYEKEGQDVIVKYESGLMNGSAMRYTLTGPNTARSELGSLHRVN